MPVTSNADASSHAFTDLRNAMFAAQTLPEQRAILERMREALRDGAVPAAQVGSMIYGLSEKPVFNETATISFLQELIATPDTAEATTTVIANYFHSNAFNAAAIKTLAEALHAYHLQPGLSDAAINNLVRTLTLDAPQANREYALGILRLRPPDQGMRDRFLSAVSNLLDAQMSPDEKRTALELFVEAAESGPLPEPATKAIYRTATAEPDAALRIAAWPLLLQSKFEQRDSERGAYHSLGSRLSEQLIAPVTGSMPSFIEANDDIREQAVTLLNAYWHPEYHSDYIDTLITLVDKHGSRASMEKLLQLRRINALNDDQLTALTRIAAEDSALVRSIKSIIIPNLAAGSLVGPAEVIAYSNDPEEWARATAQLLAQHPNGGVPASVADAAYSVMARSSDYDAAAVALFVRGDTPFAEREAKVLKLVDSNPRHPDHIVKALQHLHGDVGLDVLVRRYANNQSIEETVRRALLNMFYAEVRESRQMDAATTAAVADFGRTADSSFSINVASKILETSGMAIPWSIRIRQDDFQWQLLSWLGLLSLAVGAAAGLYALVLVALPRRKSGLRGAHRAIGFALWLILSALFAGAALAALLHSIGHNSAPPPDRALPYYAATLAISIVLLMLAVGLRRQRDRGSTIPQR